MIICPKLICSKEHVCACLASGNRTNDDEWLFAGYDRFRQQGIGRFVGKVLLTGKEAQKRTTLKGVVIADSTTQHGIASLQGIEDRTLGDRSFDFKCYFVADVRQIAEMIGKNDANHRSRSSQRLYLYRERRWQLPHDRIPGIARVR